MRKLNNKGYMLVEIIISFCIAMSIVFYLLNLTYKFKNVNEDVYQSTLYLKDKQLITKNIMNDLNRGVVSNINSCNDSSNEISFEITLDGATESERREIMVTSDSSGVIVEYGKMNNTNHFVTTDVSYFEKTIEKSLMFKGLKCKVKDNKIVTIQLSLESIYQPDEDYNINLIANYKA